MKELRAQATRPPAGGAILDLFGKYAADPTFAEAVRAGKEWRDQVNRESLEEFDREQGREAANGTKPHTQRPKTTARRGTNAGA